MLVPLDVSILPQVFCSHCGRASVVQVRLTPMREMILEGALDKVAVRRSCISRGSFHCNTVVARWQRICGMLIQRNKDQWIVLHPIRVAALEAECSLCNHSKEEATQRRAGDARLPEIVCDISKLNV